MWNDNVCSTSFRCSSINYNSKKINSTLVYSRVFTISHSHHPESLHHRGWSVILVRGIIDWNPINNSIWPSVTIFPFIAPRTWPDWLIRKTKETLAEEQRRCTARRYRLLRRDCSWPSVKRGSIKQSNHVNCETVVPVWPRVPVFRTSSQRIITIIIADQPSVMKLYTNMAAQTTVQWTVGVR